MRCLKEVGSSNWVELFLSLGSFGWELIDVGWTLGEKGVDMGIVLHYFRPIFVQIENDWQPRRSVGLECSPSNAQVVHMNKINLEFFDKPSDFPAQPDMIYRYCIC